MIKAEFDFDDIYDLLGLSGVADKTMADAARDLTVATHAHIIEEANKILHTRRGMFIEALSYFQIAEDTWVISLEGSARWIDEGMDPHSMLESLLASPKAKTAKDGSKYLVVPFSHAGGPTQLTPAQQNLLSTIKEGLKSRNIPYQKLERDDTGSPKLGKLHSFSIMDKPLKTHNGVGQGHGPIGAPLQGPTGIPYLQGLNIYQNAVKDSKGKEHVRRDIMTFRVASSKMLGTGRWEHPGLQKTDLMKSGLDFANSHWEKVVAPSVIGKMMIEMK